MSVHRITIVRLLTLVAIIASLGSMGYGSAQSEVAPAAQPALPTNGDPLANHLAADGSLATTGYSGTLDPTGYTLTFGPSGEPRFVPTAQPAQEGDQYWDSRFGTVGIPSGGALALATDAAGNLYVGGRFSETIPGVAAKGIARWDGKRWHTLGEGISGSFSDVEDIVVIGTTVYVSGDFTNAGGVLVNHLAQWNGTAWAAVGDGTGPTRQTDFGNEDGEIYALAAGPDGSLYVGGYFNRIDGVPAQSIARWNGTAWSALGGGLTDPGFEEGQRNEATVYAIVVADNGTVYAGGDFTYADDVTAYSVAAWNGTAWSALGGGLTRDNEFDPPGRVEVMALGNGVLYAAGYFTKAGNAAARNIAAWNGTAWSPLGSGLSEEFQGEDPTAYAMLPIEGGLLVGGTFTNAGNQNIKGLAIWNGSQWQPMPVALEDPNELNVQALAAAPDGSFYAAGQIDGAGGRLLFGVAQWNDEGWQPLGQGVAQYSDNPADIRSVAIDDEGRVYIAGLIQRAGGLAVNNVAMWDGERWNTMNGGVTGGTSGAYVILPVGDDVYVGGTFTQAGTVAASRIARWNRTSGQWSSLSTGVDGDVYALAYGDGLLFAGGGFAKAGNATALDVAIWDGTQWAGLGGDFEIFEIFDNGSEAGTYVQALVYTNGELYIGGHFQVLHQKGTSTTNPATYTVVHNLASYNLATELWSLLGTPALPGVTTDNRSGFGTDVNAMALVGTGLYVGGTFNGAGGITASNLARYDIVANTWSVPGSIGGVRDDAVEGLAGYGPDLFVVGAFTSAGDANARFVARYNTLTGTWSTLGTGLRWYNDTFTSANAVAVAEGGVYIGGKFDKAGPHPSLGFARWNGPLNGVVPGQDFRLFVPQVRR
jgi:trimeric autotransporter adhesin